MNEHTTETRSANRRALPKFLLTVLCAALVGGVFGFCGAYFGLDGLSAGLGRAGEFFSMHVAPWLLLACAVVQPLVCVPMYRRAKRRLAGWDGEDEAVSDAADRDLSILTWVAGMFALATLFLMGAAYAGPILEGEKPRFLSLFGTPVFFIAAMVENLLLQQRVVDLNRKMSPEKTASIYDMRFQEKWLDSCDEAEKLLIGQCAYRAYSAASKACVGLWLAFTLSALFFDTGFLPVLAVCVIWGVLQSVYCRWSLKLSRPGNCVL